MPSLGDGFGDEDLHAPVRGDGRRERCPRLRQGRPLGGRRRPRRARPARPCSRDTISSVLIAPRISSRVTEPRWPSRKILPVSLPWPPARTTPRRLTSPLNAFQSRSVGDVRGGHRARGVARVGEELEAEGVQAGPGGGGARLVAGEDAGRRPRAAMSRRPSSTW